MHSAVDVMARLKANLSLIPVARFGIWPGVQAWRSRRRRARFL